MIRKVALAVVLANSLFFPAPQVQAQPMWCYWGYVVNTVDGYPACIIDDQPGGCEYCEVTPTCP